jgi:hypothetical protein
MLFCGCLVLLIRRGWRAAIIMNTLPAAAYGVWFLAVGVTRVTVTGTIGAIPGDVARGLTGSLSAVFGLPYVGIPLLAGLCWFVWKQRRELRGWLALPVAMAASAVVFGSLTAIGRGSVEAALVPRYFYLDLVLLTPLLGLAATRLIQGQRVRRLAIIALALVGTGTGWTLLLQASDAYAGLNEQTHEYVTAAAVLAATKPSAILLPASGSIENHFFPYIDVANLDQFLRDGALSYDVQPRRVIDLAVELQLQTTVTSQPVFSQTSVATLASSPPGAISPMPACATLNVGRSTEFALVAPGSLRLVAGSSAAEVLVGLRDGTRASAVAPHASAVASYMTRYVNSTVTGATLTLELLKGSIDVCGAYLLHHVASSAR